MGSFDSTQISELVGCSLLYKINDIIELSCHELYRDDGLIMIDNCTLRKDIIRKKLHWLVNKFKLDIQANLNITDYLDVTFNLYNRMVSLFRKKTINIHVT